MPENEQNPKDPKDEGQPKDQEPEKNEQKNLPQPSNESVQVFPSSSSTYNTQAIIKVLDDNPIVDVRRSGKYYLNMKDTLVESYRTVKKDERTGRVIRKHVIEKLNPVEHVVSRFCEDVLSISRSTFLPLTSQGERHLIWVGKKKARHIIRRLNGNGCYVVNRFPGDIFLKDKQVMGVVLSHYMMMQSNKCRHECGAASLDGTITMEGVTSKPCEHMVRTMTTSCSKENCDSKGKKCCSHLEFFIPEVQSFCTYNALLKFSNRLRGELKGQTFVCKPAYLTKGSGIRFLHSEEEFQDFYHMTEGKETSRHDFMVQRLVNDPLLYKGYKFDIRAFLLVVVLRFRRVLSFVHYGFCRRAEKKYMDKDNDIECCTGSVASNKDDGEANPTPEDEAGAPKPKKKNDPKKLERHKEVIICNYQSKEDQQRSNKLRQDDNDRSMKLEYVFDLKKNQTPSTTEGEDGVDGKDGGNENEKENEEKNKKKQQAMALGLESVKSQIKNIATKITQTIENKVWDWFGCFQIFSMDMCVQERPTDQNTDDETKKDTEEDDSFKVWLLEINSHALSQVDTASETQRKIVPAVLSEAIGLVAETQYKSFHNMRLRSDPMDAVKHLGLVFQKNYELAYDTPPKKRMDYKPPKPKKSRNMPYIRRIDVVDEQMKTAKYRSDLQKRIVKEKERKRAEVAKSSEEGAGNPNSTPAT